MTREEAKKLINKKLTQIITGTLLPNLTIENSELSDIVDEIYDDFESRVCKNCKYAEKHENGDEHKCEILMATTQEEAKKLIEVGFGCNRFERRGNERD